MNANIINILVDQFAIYVLPPLIGAVWFFVVVGIKKASENLPINLRKLLWDFANTAVKSAAVDQGYTAMKPDEIRAAVKEETVRLLGKKADKLPEGLIDRVIMQIEYELINNKKKAQ